MSCRRQLFFLSLDCPIKKRGKKQVAFFLKSLFSIITSMISNYRTCGIYNNNDITTSYCHFTILLPLWTCDNCDWSTGRNRRFHGYVSQHLLWLSKKKNNEKEKCRTYSVVSADQRAEFCLNIIIIVIYLLFDCNCIFVVVTASEICNYL